ncbi:hypothetical protein GMAR_ORF214 [Golden Marseillevirus]|uniref:hypothetical protein n=1 Tax=Golden Marseillevirus TaxID=1720526 RepID=UPI000877A95D|nr:hypothetical protein GMAR_ORF214 [Golden Marseillevirus]ALX27588.1 hypothetical protein GMAR_ORF214 [Golden Marseillevirus]
MATKFEDILKKEVLGMLDELLSVFAEEKENRADVLLVKLFFTALPSDKLMEHFVKHVLPHEKRILEREEKFFIENTSIWQGLPENKVKMVSEMWQKGRFTEEDKEMLWAYFDCFLELSKSSRKHK